MSNGRATLHFEGINLDNCLKVGMKISGYARCPYCKQLFSYQLHLRKPGKPRSKNTEDTYEVIIDFSGSVDPAAVADLALPPQAEDDMPCIPCRGCSRACPRLQR